MGIFVFLGLSFVVIFHELGHFLMSKIFGVAVEEFGIGFPPKIWSKKIKETIYSFNWILWGGFLKINGLRPETEKKDLPPNSSFCRQAFYKKALIVSGGVLINFILGWALLSLIMFIGIPQNIFISDIKENSLALSSGFQKGDLIVGFENSKEFNTYLNNNLGKEVVFNIKRNGDEGQIKVNLPAERLENKEILGIYYGETGVPKANLWDSLVGGFTNSCLLIWNYLKAYIDLFSRIFVDASVFQNLMSPIGLFSMGSLVSKAGILYFVQLLAFLSLNLVIFNFLPFPMLDGGWFLILLIEKIKGSPINPKTEMVLNGFGFLVLFSLLFVVTIKDLINLF